jgi:TPR repeat protein
MGLPQAALRLGATFDPAEIPALRATGLAADPKEARVWYERARELGAAEATSRLSRLPN